MEQFLLELICQIVAGVLVVLIVRSNSFQSLPDSPPATAPRAWFDDGHEFRYCLFSYSSRPARARGLKPVPSRGRILCGGSCAA